MEEAKISIFDTYFFAFRHGQKAPKWLRIFPWCTEITCNGAVQFEDVVACAVPWCFQICRGQSSGKSHRVEMSKNCFLMTVYFSANSQLVWLPFFFKMPWHLEGLPHGVRG